MAASQKKQRLKFRREGLRLSGVKAHHEEAPVRRFRLTL
jgi:hypothetical protein